MSPSQLQGRRPTRWRSRCAHCLGALALWILAAGCNTHTKFHFDPDQDLTYFKDTGSQIEYPDVESKHLQDQQLDDPHSLSHRGAAEYFDISLDEAIRLALSQSKVIRDLSGRVVNSPQRATSVYEPAIQQTDPRFGVEAALSQFDARLRSGVSGEKQDRVINNAILGGGVRQLQRDLFTWETELSKRTATGGQFFLRHDIEYDANNRTTNLFPSAWQAITELEFRHPLRQGAGVEFNRIAGPNAIPGLSTQNGVMLARIDNDISLADFESGVTQLVSEVESAYWELYYSYRYLDTRIRARDSALATWRKIKRYLDTGAKGGDVGSEARAAAAYFALQAQVEDALSGSLASNKLGPEARLATSLTGLYNSESNLRLLVGLPEADGRLLRPADEPTTARLLFDWSEVVAESTTRRVELRQQKWRVKRRELELAANRNFLRSRLDSVGTYRVRGFGDDLFTTKDEDLASAYATQFSGNYQEFSVGLQFEAPLGKRLGHTAVRNAQLKLARERALLDEQERQVVHQLAGAVRELYRAQSVARTYLSGLAKARERVAAVRREFDAGIATLDQVLDAEEEEALTESRYHRAVLEYNLAIKEIHLQKGSLLDYNNVFLTEGPWPAKAYEDAKKLARKRALARKINYGLTKPADISRGVYPQEATPVTGMPTASLGTTPLETIPTPSGATPAGETPGSSPLEPPPPAPVRPESPAPGIVDPLTPSPHDAPPAPPGRATVPGEEEGGLAPPVPSNTDAAPSPPPAGDSEPLAEPPMPDPSVPLDEPPLPEAALPPPELGTEAETAPTAPTSQEPSAAPPAPDQPTVEEPISEPPVEPPVEPDAVPLPEDRLPEQPGPESAQPQGEPEPPFDTDPPLEDSTDPFADPEAEMNPLDDPADPAMPDETDPLLEEAPAEDDPFEGVEAGRREPRRLTLSHATTAQQGTTTLLRISSASESPTEASTAPHRMVNGMRSRPQANPQPNHRTRIDLDQSAAPVDDASIDGPSLGNPER